MWVIFIYILSSFLIDALNTTIPLLNSHKYLIWNIYSIFEFLCYSYFFYIVIKSRIIKTSILFCCVIYFLLFFFLPKTSSEQFNSVMSAIGSVIVIVLSLCYFMVCMKPTADPVDILTPTFLIVISIFIYVTSTLFLYLLVNRFSGKEMQKYWQLNDFSNILTNIILSSAFLLFRFKHKSAPPENRHVDFTNPYDR
jgi:hypothetical protein